MAPFDFYYICGLVAFILFNLSQLIHIIFSRVVWGFYMFMSWVKGRPNLIGIIVFSVKGSKGALYGSLAMLNNLECLHISSHI